MDRRPTRHCRRCHTRGPCAFSLVELVVVVTIIGIIASIAVPRISSAASNSRANALQATLANIRKAIDVYYAEHGRYPGYNPATGLPDNNQFIDQLTMYSNEAGGTSPTMTSDYLFGPYLRPPFPKNPGNDLDTVHVKAKKGDADPAPGSVGWVAVLSEGHFGILATDDELDELGITGQTLQKVVRGLAVD